MRRHFNLFTKSKVMKKIFIGMVAFTLCLGMNSCKKEATTAKDEKTTTEQTVKASDQTVDATGQAPDATGQASDATGQDAATSDQASEKKQEATEAKGQAAEKPLKDAAALLAKAKAEGSNWSVEEWKNAFKEFALIEKPLMIELQNIIDGILNKSTNIEELKTKNKNLEATFKEINKYYDEFEKFGLSTPNGKTVLGDKEWLKKTQQELGIPDL